MQKNPYLMLVLAFIISSVMLGFAVRTLERPYYQDDQTGESEVKGAGYQDYNFIMNGWWLIVVTMTTVGFGDFYAKTYLGRMISSLACIYGTFLVSLMVVTLQSQQQKAFDSLRSIAHFQLKKIAAAKYIFYRFKFYKINKKLCQQQLIDKKQQMLFEDIKFRKEKARVDFKYLYKQIQLNPDTEILFLEDIDEKIRQIYQSLEKDDRRTEMYQQEFQNAKLQKEIKLQQENRNILKYKLTKIQQELQHRLKDDKYNHQIQLENEEDSSTQKYPTKSLNFDIPSIQVITPSSEINLTEGIQSRILKQRQSQQKKLGHRSRFNSQDDQTISEIRLDLPPRETNFQVDQQESLGSSQQNPDYTQYSRKRVDKQNDIMLSLKPRNKTPNRIELIKSRTFLTEQDFTSTSQTQQLSKQTTFDNQNSRHQNLSIIFDKNAQVRSINDIIQDKQGQIQQSFTNLQIKKATAYKKNLHLKMNNNQNQ
ncbi:small-conductance calcium-activated potassium channel protein [Stylonychia lemnae]|uniref:Small-conductance calcium-activated potassium channel protein n=1 Tax=Stylonychia lemnae TaxID=5949 RepID=A0A078AG52_STYLE|nr:small-conductance calcium-activated potassium channel protein [Stylonychia lemnae]|eukprot:CDW79848.1 small-conductance calcium-activated potassium channel protein [Stylonychia lemnae]